MSTSSAGMLYAPTCFVSPSYSSVLNALELFGVKVVRLEPGSDPGTSKAYVLIPSAMRCEDTRVMLVNPLEVGRRMRMVLGVTNRFLCYAPLFTRKEEARCVGVVLAYSLADLLLSTISYPQELKSWEVKGIADSEVRKEALFWIHRMRSGRSLSSIDTKAIRRCIDRAAEEGLIPAGPARWPTSDNIIQDILERIIR